jgi:hypothetical protein
MAAFLLGVHLIDILGAIFASIIGFSIFRYLRRNWPYQASVRSTI